MYLLKNPSFDINLLKRSNLIFFSSYTFPTYVPNKSRTTTSRKPRSTYVYTTTKGYERRAENYNVKAQLGIN